MVWYSGEGKGEVSDGMVEGERGRRGGGGGGGGGER